MTQYETCRHVKEDGAYCGSPALREPKYCYYHLMQRGRRLRRARALRDNVPYRLEIHCLDNLYAVRDALSDIAQALAAGPLESPPPRPPPGLSRPNTSTPARPASFSTPPSGSPPPPAASRSLRAVRDSSCPA